MVRSALWRRWGWGVAGGKERARGGCRPTRTPSWEHDPASPKPQLARANLHIQPWSLHALLLLLLPLQSIVAACCFVPILLSAPAHAPNLAEEAAGCDDARALALRCWLVVL